MYARLGKLLLVLGCVFATGISARAASLGAKTCTEVWPKPFPAGQPYLLNDPRSGLLLYVEGDGRHMAAITRDGKILWHRNLFADPRLERILVPPPPIEGQPTPSPEQWRQHVRSFLSHLSIDRIGVEPDCWLHYIDHDLPPQLRGHYIRAGSGTYIFWLIDAKTGDLQMEEMN